MPIKGRSEIVRIPRVGKIHLGIKKKNSEGKEYPSPTDYFVVRPDDHTTNEAVKAFQSVYGNKPNEIKVAFPSDAAEDFFPQYLTAYKSGGGKNYTLFCRGDGEKATRRAEDGSFSEMECQFENCPIYQKKQCKALGRLQFFLPEVPGIGVWQIDTTSYHTTVNLNSSIAMIMALTGGRIKMIPLTLRLVPKVVSPEGFSKTVYVLDLRVEDVKLLDFIQQVPLISAALTPAVEPIRADEIAEDLFIESDAVDDGHSADKTSATDIQTEDHEFQVGSGSDTTNVAVFIRRQWMRDEDGHYYAALQLGHPSGHELLGYAYDEEVLKTLKNAHEGDLYHYEATEAEGQLVFHRMIKAKAS